MSSHRRICNVRICTYVTKELGKWDQNPEISVLAKFGGSRLAQRIPIGKSVKRTKPGVWMIGFQREKFVSRKLIFMRMSGFHHFMGKIAKLPQRTDTSEEEATLSRLSLEQHCDNAKH